MRALVTGATGFIGSHLCEELIRRGFEVTYLSRDTSDRRWVKHPGLTCVRGDCTVKESLGVIPGDFDFIFHLAGLTKSCSPDDFFSVNARGTENFLITVAERNPSLKRFVYLSSLAAVGPSKDGRPVREDVPPSPVSNYGISKLEGERAVAKYRDVLPVTILRPPAVYGPRDRDMLVMFRMIKKGFFFDLGKCYYSLLYVDDLIDGILLSAQQSAAIGGIYFLCDGEIHPSEDIVQQISNVLQVRARRVRLPKRAFSVIAAISERIEPTGIINRDRVRDFAHTHWICDGAKAREEIGFRPKITMEEGIRRTADWYREHKWL